MATYYHILEEVRQCGPYMGDVIGKCLRQIRSFSGPESSRIDKFFQESATFKAAKTRRDLKAEFSPTRAVKGFLVWQESRKFETRAYFPIEVDEAAGVVRQLDTDIYGLLEDVRPCLHHKTTKGDYVIWGASGSLPLSQPTQAEIDKYDPTKSKFGTVGRPGRIQQNGWRERVATLWKNECAITGCRNASLLDGAHIVPHSKATTQQRLDEQNGIYLATHLHRAFDRGLISFSADGVLLFSPLFTASDRKAIGIPLGAKLGQMPTRTKRYLETHRAFYGFL